ncbi:MAG: glutamate 5-kinase [Planctomycetes bacterium]|nr:glutamate 5-kinase [Planctomycetota bacterium]
MTAEIRKRAFVNAKILVVKIGTNVLSLDNGLLDRDRIRKIAAEVVQLREDGYNVVIVSSGAIGAGMAELGMAQRPTALPELQAAASVGQGKLIAAYDECFREQGYYTGQILITREDVNDRQRYLNGRNTILSLLSMGAIPVINENDTISIDEITFSDNDILSALVASLVKADVLIMLSPAPGLCRQEQVIDVVERIDKDVKRLASGDTSARGAGGMDSKLEAASMACRAGTATIIAPGREENILTRIVSGEPIGTLFLAGEEKIASRKGWIGMAAQSKGVIHVDAGAARAVQERGKSLLASGIVDATGDFQKGDVVSISADGTEIARGLTNYSSDDVKQIMGLRSSKIANQLGSKSYDEVVHRNNMVLVKGIET